MGFGFAFSWRCAEKSKGIVQDPKQPSLVTYELDDIESFSIPFRKEHVDPHSPLLNINFNLPLPKELSSLQQLLVILPQDVVEAFNLQRLKYPNDLFDYFDFLLTQITFEES